MVIDSASLHQKAGFIFLFVEESAPGMKESQFFSLSAQDRAACMFSVESCQKRLFWYKCMPFSRDLTISHLDLSHLTL